jgi:hypothetical protein
MPTNPAPLPPCNMQLQETYVRVIMSSSIKSSNLILTEKAYIMDTNIKWETDFNVALSKAKLERKHALIDFFNPN